ncbi:MAG: hypothetical protein EXX96DRAFT_592949 [Benjaminiella poitrasii]|nr:MAG: hypothetical protein EXX96DRAFT_592949 [Benjaminiella poitrasii]
MGLDNSDFLPEASQINLDYAAPEFVLDNNISQTNDMFSLGCLAYAVHNKGVSILKTFNSFHAYEKQIRSLASSSFLSMPAHLQDVIRSLLTRHPNQRMDPISFQSSKYFDNLLVSTMKFLESFPEKTREEKAQFMKGLARVLGQFPERVLKRKILPSLLEELKDSQLLPYTIPNVFVIAQKLSQQEFCSLILPSLKHVFQVRDPPQNMIVLLEKLDILQQKTPREIFRDDVMPLVYAALESPASVVQEKALRIIPSLAESLDYTAVKSSLFPRVQTVFVQTTILSVKVSTLICFHAMIKVLDKFTVQEKLVPLLKNIKTKEPAVMLATLAVYDEIGKVADKEIIATEILPQLWKMSFGPLLNLEQFKKFMKTIHDLTSRVEDAHTKHLQEVKSLEEQTRSVSRSSGAIAAGSPQLSSANQQPVLGADSTLSFEALVQGTNNMTVNSSPDMFGNLVNNPIPQKSPMLSNTWSSTTPSMSQPTIQPTPLQPQHNTTANTNHTSWNPPKPTAPSSTSNGWSTNRIAAPQNTILSTATLTPTSSNWSSPSFQNATTTTATTPAMNPQQIPSLTSPTSFNGNANYNALRGLSNGNNNQQQQPSMIPLSANIGLLQPISSSSNKPLQNNMPQVTKTNLHAFDPLG